MTRPHPRAIYRLNEPPVIVRFTSGNVEIFITSGPLLQEFPVSTLIEGWETGPVSLKFQSEQQPRRPVRQKRAWLYIGGTYDRWKLDRQVTPMEL